MLAKVPSLVFFVPKRAKFLLKHKEDSVYRSQLNDLDDKNSCIK
jgi:hypothetical protein